MYFFTTEQLVDEHFIAHFFQRVNPSLSIELINNITDIVYDYQGIDALEHLFDVASSLDSLVIGERQILRQLREAYEQCYEWGLTGDKIRMAFQQALQGAKTVYANTGIGEKPISVVSLAIQKMLHAHVPKESKILLIGAGQTNQLVAKFLLKHHFNNVTVFNRSIERAEKLAQSFEGEAYTLDVLNEYDKGFDVMIVCTGATEAIITESLYTKLIGTDRTQKVVIDLAIPNNVAPEVVANQNIEYIEIEGLRNLAKANLAYREQEVVKAKALLKKFLGEFPRLLKQRQIEVAMRSVPTEIKAVKHKAVNEVFHKEIASLDENTKALMMEMLSYMEKKCISIPMKAAREAVLG